MQLSWEPVAQGTSGCCIKLLTRAVVSYEDSNCRESASKLAHFFVGGMQFFTVYCMETSVSHWLLPGGPCCMSLSLGQLAVWWLAFLRANEWESKGGVPRWKPQPFFNVIWQVTSYLFGHVLFVGTNSVSSAYTQGEGTSRVKIQRSWGHGFPP